MTRAIGIVSGKGGVGKTTLAINIAAALARHYNKRCALVDCNLTTSHVSLYLGIYNKTTTLNHVLRNERRMDEAVHHHESGMKIIPASLSISDLDGVDILQIKDRIKPLKDQNDVVLLDAAPGLGREAVGALKACDEVIFVTTPTVLGITDILRTNEVCKELSVPNLGIVLNMVHRDKYEVTRKEVEHITGLPVIASIPFHDDVRKSLHAKQPVITTHPRSKVSSEIIGLAGRIAGMPYYERRGFFGRLFGR